MLKNQKHNVMRFTSFLLPDAADSSIRLAAAASLSNLRLKPPASNVAATTS